MPKVRGFTIIELMITVAIVGILATVAYPSYQSSVLRSKRTLAKARLMDIVEQQTKYFIDNRTYGDMTDLGFSADTIGIDNNGNVAVGTGNYDVSVTLSTATAFSIQAVAKNQMLNDSACTTLSINLQGTRSPVACW